MAIRTTNVVTPVFATAEVVVLLSARVTGQTRLRDFLGRLVFEGNDLLRIAFLNMGLAWTMTRLTARYLLFPATDLRKLRVGSV